MIVAAALLALQPVRQQPSLSIFAPFLGACWRTDLKAALHDTHCFEPMYGGAHVRDRHEVQVGGGTVYAGETIYSIDGPDLVFTYYNVLGGVGRGKVRAEGKLIDFTGTMHSFKRAPEPIDSQWRLIDGDHYEVRSLVPAKSGQLESPHLFTRVPGLQPK